MSDTPQLAQPALESNLVYAAPWRDRLPDGSLSEPFGPASAAAQAAQTARIRDWSWRAPPRADNRRSKLCVEFEALPVDVANLSERERQVHALALQGHAVRWIARHLGMRRETVKSYCRRIRAKAGLTDGG